jgi:DNA repair exonuclease SbcCD ATPase subunit
MKERMAKIDENKVSIIKLSNEFDAIKETNERIEEVKGEIDERRQKVKAIEARLKPLTQERDRYKFQENKIAEFKMEKEILEQNLQILTLVRDALSTNKGMPVDILKMYVDEIRKAANLLLSDTFDGTLYLEQFVITDKEFTIPFQHNGDRVDDISKASSSERAFISTCLSMAIMEQIIANYGILNLDELDKGFSEHNKAVYCVILMKQMQRVGIIQVFFATHSREYYEAYDVCYVLFPEHTLKSSGKDVIKVY